MMERGRRRIWSKTVRNLLSLAHYDLSSHQAQELPKLLRSALDAMKPSQPRQCPGPMQLLRLSGWLTSVPSLKTVTLNGRDYNGARGIYLPYLRMIVPDSQGIAFRSARSVSESRLRNI